MRAVTSRRSTSKPAVSALTILENAGCDRAICGARWHARRWRATDAFPAGAGVGERPGRFSKRGKRAVAGREGDIAHWPRVTALCPEKAADCGVAVTDKRCCGGYGD
jgi:hypothetical protein